MICPKCKEQELKSGVFPGISTRTLVYCAPFYDESGNYHIHDSNITTTGYRCTNGHEWSDKSMGRCWCGWGVEKC